MPEMKAGSLPCVVAKRQLFEKWTDFNVKKQTNENRRNGESGTLFPNNQDHEIAGAGNSLFSYAWKGKTSRNGNDKTKNGNRIKQGFNR